MNKLEQLRQRKADYERELERIRGARDYNDGARARRIAPLYSNLKAEERRTLDEVRDELKDRVRSAEKKAFAPSKPLGADPALAQMNARDAFSRAAKTTDARDLEAMFEQADLLGDKTLMRAVAGQLLNGARACVRDGLTAREQEELVGRLEELEASLQGRKAG